MIIFVAHSYTVPDTCDWCGAEVFTYDESEHYPGMPLDGEKPPIELLLCSGCNSGTPINCKDKWTPYCVGS